MLPNVAGIALGHRPEALARDLEDIADRGITSPFVFSRGDGGLDYFQLYASPALRRRKTRKRTRRVVVDGAGHTFRPPAAQRAPGDLLNDFVSDPGECETAGCDRSAAFLDGKRDR